MDVKGDLDVCRTLTARRANLGLQETAALAAALDIEMHSAQYQYVATDTLGDENVNMPDATTLPEGWAVTIDNFSAGDNLVVKNGAGAPATIHTVSAGEACIFTLVDNGTAAGTWRIHCLNNIAERFCDDFVIADFGVIAAGYHEYTVTAATHGRGSQPIVQLAEKTGTDHDLTHADRTRIAANGDITIRVTGDDGETPDIDCRFDGRMCIM